MVRLSAHILTRPQIPAFNGSIEVDITAEDLPRKYAEFGKCHPSVVHNNVCLVSYCPFCIVIFSIIIDKITIQKVQFVHDNNAACIYI